MRNTNLFICDVALSSRSFILWTNQPNTIMRNTGTVALRLNIRFLRNKSYHYLDGGETSLPQNISFLRLI